MATDQITKALAEIDEMLDHVRVMMTALEVDDADTAYGAATVILIQCVQTYGTEHPVFRGLFPSLNEIERRISGGVLDLALRQARQFERDLREVRAFVMGAVN